MRHRALGALAAATWVALAGQSMTASAATSSPNDPWFATGRQWGLNQAGFPAAWCVSSGAGALIAVIDGGVDFSHPDLAGKSAGSTVVQNGQVVPGEVNTDHGHATHVAGIAAADTNNGTGMAGAAPAARLYSVQMLFGGGQGTSTDLATAINFITNQVAPTWPGPVVLNVSVGATTGTTPPEVAAAISSAYAHGLGVAVAAGDQPGGSGYAQMGSQAMVVGALNRAGGVASYSPTGGVNVFAAGGENLGGTNVNTGIISTYGGGQYAWLTGTSMATPHVAAALALLMSTGLTNQQAYARIEGTEGAGGSLRIDRALGRTAGCGAPAAAPAPPPVRTVPRPTAPPPVVAAAPPPAGGSVQTAPPVTLPNTNSAPATAAATPAPVVPSASEIPYDEGTHPLRSGTPSRPAAETLVGPATGLRTIPATIAAGARTDPGRLSLSAAAAFAVAYLSALALWRRLHRVRVRA
ncbi:MAG TPA: S8 family serine peptidase [Candidatus Dormibacteraeota bacterium]|jgi:subtilisin family serine protease|nr:S8 family serine peptidase [Candidatus Dormibacteraeota bacterium]